MNYSELMQMYFERSTALQWYWTLYVIVIGGVLGFSTFRQKPEAITVVFVTILYGCFAYKNLGAIEATLQERDAVLTAIKAHPPSEEVNRVRDVVLPTLLAGDVNGTRYFHVGCDLLTIAAVWAKEWLRRKADKEGRS